MTRGGIRALFKRDLDVVPDLVFHVLSQGDSWRDAFAMMVKSLLAGVPIVCIFDPRTKSFTVFDHDNPPRVFSGDDILTLASFELPVGKLPERYCGDPRDVLPPNYPEKLLVVAPSSSRDFA